MSVESGLEDWTHKWTSDVSRKICTVSTVELGRCSLDESRGRREGGREWRRCRGVRRERTESFN